jgi:pimeloyl-ACP methyl ester carboxylesterase
MIRKQNFSVPGAKGRIILIDITFDDALKNAPAVIFAHGFKGFKDWGAHNLVAQYFAERGFRYLKFNFSHNGTTVDNPFEFNDLIAFGDNTFSMELDDLGAVIDFVSNGSSMPAANTIYLIGHSMGGGVSIIKAAEDPRIKKLVTLASISDFRDLWAPEMEEQWRLSGIIYMPNTRTGQQMPLKVSLLNDLDKNRVRLDILSQAAKIKQPWLIVHGSADSSVPFSQAEELKKANKDAALAVIPEGDHTFGASHPYTKATLPVALLECCSQIVNFFNIQQVNTT